MGERDEAFPIQRGGGDGFIHPAGPDPRRPIERGEPKIWDIEVPDRRVRSIKMPTRDCR